MVALAPNAVLVVTKNNNARLCAKGKKDFVTFNGEDTHSQDGFWSTLFVYSLIFTERYLAEGAKALNPLFLFIETVEPNFPVRVAIGKAFKKE
jgi:hypothetical protein